MKVYSLTSPNFMANKVYKVFNKETFTLIQVSSPFVGNWEFELNSMTYEQVCFGLERYISGKLIQEAFPNLSVDEREGFITPPSMWLNV